MNSKLHVDADGNKYWHTGVWTRDRNFLHRIEIDPYTMLSLPAVEHMDGDKWWYVNDELHREDGPAIEYSSGKTSYYIEGEPIAQLDNKHIYGKENLSKYLILL